VDSATARAENALLQVRNRKLTSDQQTTVNRVRTFIRQAREAKARGDLVNARNLAERADLLSRDLVSSLQ
jgi:hypothetical protein